MSSLFDRQMRRADAVLFDAFGDKGVSYQDPHCLVSLSGLTIIISHNVEMAGPDGVFRPIQHLAEIRLAEVPQPRAGGVLQCTDGRYRLDERMRSDGLVEYWSLLPVR